MVVDRMLPTDDARALLELVTRLADRELAPNAAKCEEAGEFPREVIALLGRSGLLSLTYPERYGGGGVSYEVYLQALEEIGARWASVAVGISVHSLACYPVAAFGTDEQRDRLLPGMLSGDRLGAYSLSEAQAGSDPAAIATRARKVGTGYELSGTKAWVTPGGEADFYTVFARLDEGISCFFLPAGTEGMSFGRAERKMGLTGSTTASVILDGARTDELIGAPGQGLQIAFSALDNGRLGIAACAVGLAQAALDAAVSYANS